MNRRIIICFILIVLAIWIGWQYLMPAFGKVTELRNEQAVWQKKLSETQELSKKLETLRKKYNNMINESEKIAQAIPSGQDIPGLLVQLEGLASQNGLVMDNVNFSVADDAKNKPKNQTAGSGTKTVAGVKTLSINMGLSGGQTAFKEFLKAVENNLRIMDVSSFSLAGQSSISTIAGASGEGFKVSLNAYFRE